MPNVPFRRAAFKNQVVEPSTKLELTLNEVDLLLDAIDSHMVQCEEWGECTIPFDSLSSKIKQQVNAA